ncbi:N-acetylglucosamine-6-phosphate deacetylase [Coniosporium apollinis CBS 100218]|uniref:N-acetylglucosamine-6-phosphate deacetylase n=1 Tax=Coniosporium apollinis (strain CBS 100218) TaxID=1168221 RepID=R7YS71_CONA1|nr:N-acetylglucosamine-6-phosphate deacetylase [Coniosporium apollinis CBS 100218]EON64683.1 N-acetylglucosamine-6-phosphate deacetylase [Coniosporium apollinis CBS 100218]
MPAATADLHSPARTPSGIIKFTNCRLARNKRLTEEDLWLSSITGKILNCQEAFYEHRASPDRTIDLGGRIVSPGLIDVQLNGGFGFDFSVAPEEITTYAKGVARLNRQLIKTGVTAYLPTLTSQRSEVYHKVLPHLGPSGSRRNPSDGAESLGAHCEGPFLNPVKKGIHDASIFLDAPSGFSSLSACYGAPSLLRPTSPIKCITLAPEIPGVLSCIPALVDLGITVSLGHTDASFEEASAGISAGASMITHLFNAMRPLHHRDPGIFGLLGTTPNSATASTTGGAGPSAKPFFGCIADGVHLHPTTVALAWSAHPDGFILVSDAMALVGLRDGTYDWTNGAKIRKEGYVLTLEGEEKIAGSAVTLVECVNNCLNWSGASVAEVLGAVTATPARMLGLEGKGCLEPGADADLVVLEERVNDGGWKTLEVDQVWKFGVKVFDKEQE